VDLVKVGVAGGGTVAQELLRALATCGAAVVPVFLADEGVDEALVAQALRESAFPALMLDTAAKGAGSLLQRVPRAMLSGFVARVRTGGRLAGLAGALRADDVPAIRALGPDFAGFRSAVCAGGRAQALDAVRVGEIARLLSGADLRRGPGIPSHRTEFGVRPEGQTPASPPRAGGSGLQT
jgi:uncharacterized protein (UPF0264 family)